MNIKPPGIGQQIVVHVPIYPRKEPRRRSSLRLERAEGAGCLQRPMGQNRAGLVSWLPAEHHILPFAEMNIFLFSPVGF